jgi:hypothetical protein
MRERETYNEVKRGDYTPEETWGQMVPKRSTRKLIDQRLSLGLLVGQGHTTEIIQDFSQMHCTVIGDADLKIAPLPTSPRR